MAGELLLGLFGNAVYDLVKGISRLMLGKSDEEAVGQVYAALEAAAERFFERYGNAFGRPADSFVARQSNWDAVIRSIYYSTEELKAEALDLTGFNDAPSGTPEAASFFLRVIEEEMRRHWQLDKILTEKESLRKLDQVSRIVAGLAGENQSDVLLSVNDPDRPEGWVPEKRKLYESKLPNGATIRYLLKDDGINVEYECPDGAVAYYDVDNDGNVRDYKSPYPLEEYSVAIDPSLILNEEVTALTGGLRRIVYRLKWGKRVEVIVDNSGRLQHLQIQGGSQARHAERLFIVSPPPKAE